MLSSFGMPVLFLIIFGAGFSQIIGALTPGVDFVKFIYPGIIAMTVLMTSIFSGLSVVWDREFGFLKEVLVAPLSPERNSPGEGYRGSYGSRNTGLYNACSRPGSWYYPHPLAGDQAGALITYHIPVSVWLGHPGSLTHALPARVSSRGTAYRIPSNFPVRGILPSEQCADVASGYFQGQPLNLRRRCYPSTLYQWRPQWHWQRHRQQQSNHWGNCLRTHHEYF